MKSKIVKLLTAAIAMTVITHTAQAQEATPTPATTEAKTETTLPAADSTIASNGIRVGLFLPAFGTSSKLGGYQKLSKTYGVSAGYAYIPVLNIGFIADAAYLKLKSKISSADLVRLSANATFAFNSNLYTKAGVNVSKYVRGEGVKDYDSDLGYQFGFGSQITKNAGLEIGYTQSKQKKTIAGFKDELKEYGIEIGATATF